MAVKTNLKCADCDETVEIIKGWNHWYDVVCPNGHEAKLELFGDDDPDVAIDPPLSSFFPRGWKPYCYSEKCIGEHTKRKPIPDSSCTCQECGHFHNNCTCQFLIEPCLSCRLKEMLKNG